MESEKSFLLKITIISGENLIARDMRNVSDPYVKMCWDQNVLFKTTHKNRTLNPVWNEGFTVQVKHPDKPILFQVFDKDRITSDDFMGQAYVILEDCKKGEAFDICLNLEPANDEYLIKKIKKDDKSLGSIKINVNLSLADPNKQELQKEGPSFMKSLKRQFSNEGSSKDISGIAHVVLVQAQSLTLVHGRTEYAPYCQLSLSNQKYTSKTIKDKINPKWKEAFNFHWKDEEDSHLNIETRHEDKRMRKNDEFLGSVAIDFRDFPPEVSHNIWRPLLGEKGTHVGDINIIVTITCCSNPDSPSMLTNWNPDPGREALLHDQYHVKNTLKKLEDVGHLTVKVIQASGLVPSDYNGLADPFVVLELKNARVRTLAKRETLTPEWNQLFHFNVTDINERLEITILDENDNSKDDFVGKLMIPLLAIVDGERRWFKLKDQELCCQANGKNPKILLETNIHWNPLRAAYRTIYPPETKHMDRDQTKFKFSILTHNWNRIKSETQNYVDWMYELTGRDANSNMKKIKSILNWESKVLSILSCFAFVFIVWIFEIWMVPFSLLIPFILHFLGIKRMERTQGIIGLEKQDKNNEQEDEKSTFAKMKEIGLIVQTNMAFVANIIESVGNIFNFTVPFLSKIAFLALVLLTIVLYLLPFRVCLICWGLHKLTLRLFLPGSKLFNQSLLNFILAVPNEQMLKWCREIQ